MSKPWNRPGRSLRGGVAKLVAVVATAGLGGSLLAIVPEAAAVQDRQLHRDTYQDRLHAMWLGETIANWTGLQTELHRNEPPFYTDEDWDDIGFVTDQDPWLADDDTDIEYVYAHLASQWGRAALTRREIAAGWRRHINDFIWVSNAYARGLMSEGTRPPATGMNVANPHSLAIDAQLTTELFGAFAPGMPEQALRLADRPIRTTADGHAAHASQFFVLLYSLAATVDQDLAPAEQMLSLGRQARRYLPDTSKAADIFDFVLAEYLANPDKDAWEQTRDRIYQRYQRDASENGFVYRSPVESSINFAAGVMAMLYGHGDFRRTVRIGTLSGWDSDNATATLGGLIGLMRGTDYLRAQFPGVELSDRYHIYRTRDDLPDYRPDDPAAEDTFTAIAGRMLPLVEGVIRTAGGTVAASGTWTLPQDQAVPNPADPQSLAAANPTSDLYHRSANNRVRLSGGAVTTRVSQPGQAAAGGTTDHAVIADGQESDFSGAERHDRARYFTSGSHQRQVLTVAYDRPIPVHTVRFVGGSHTAAGGWAADARLQLRRPDGDWVDAHPNSVASAPLRSDEPFQVVDFRLGNTTEATGIRLVMRLGGSDFVSVAEMDALAAPSMPSPAHPEGPLEVHPWIGTALPGSPVPVEVTLTNTGNRPWTGDLTLAGLPAQWSVSPAGVPVAALEPGETVSATFEVTAPDDVVGNHVLQATAQVGGVSLPSPELRVVVLDPTITSLNARGSQDSNSIHLDWSHHDPTGDARYNVYGSTSEDFVADDNTLVGTTSQQEFLHRGLGLRESWHYRVRVVDDAGHIGPPSELASATTGSAFKVEAESLLPPVEATANAVRQSNCCGVTWSNDAQIWFQSNDGGPGDYMTLKFDVPERGDYELAVGYTQAPDFGMHVMTLDGEQLGDEFDAYDPAVRIQEAEYGSMQLEAGTHTVTFTVTGKHPDSVGYGLGVDYIKLSTE